MNRELTTIIETAIGSVNDAYLAALAAQIQGTEAAPLWRRFAKVMARAHLLATLTGMETAANKARVAGARYDEPEQFAKEPEISIALDADITDDNPFEPGPFLEAISAFRDRVPRLKSQINRMAARSIAAGQSIAAGEQAHALTDLAKHSVAIREVMRGSFWMSDSKRQTIIDVRELLSQALTSRAEPEAMTLPEFIDAAQLAGAANLSRARLELVFRNNLMGAFSDGNAEIAKQPETRNAIPLYMISSIRDRRTRGNPGGLYPDQGRHWQMHGYINTIDEIERQGIRPPCGHQCRCVLRGVTNWEARELGLLNDDGTVNMAAVRSHNGARQDIVDRGEYPDPGWLTSAAA